MENQDERFDFEGVNGYLMNSAKIVEKRVACNVIIICWLVSIVLRIEVEAEQ